MGWCLGAKIASAFLLLILTWEVSRLGSWRSVVDGVMEYVISRQSVHLIPAVHSHVGENTNPFCFLGGVYSSEKHNIEYNTSMWCVWLGGGCALKGSMEFNPSASLVSCQPLVLALTLAPSLIPRPYLLVLGPGVRREP